MTAYSAMVLKIATKNVVYAYRALHHVMMGIPAQSTIVTGTPRPAIMMTVLQQANLILVVMSQYVMELQVVTAGVILIAMRM